MGTFNIYSSLAFNKLIEEKIENIKCELPTKSYIVNVFAKPNIIEDKSITILYSEAKFNYDFIKFQKLGDWLLFIKSLFPEHLTQASPDYYDAIAQNSYYYCYRIINKQWKVFEELADTFPKLINHLNASFL